MPDEKVQLAPPVLEPEKHTPDSAHDSGGSGPATGTPGGSGGDDWENQPQGRRGPHERIRLFRLCIGLTVAAIFMLFFAITSAAVASSGGQQDPSTGEVINPWRPLQTPNIIWLNTVLLAISSFTLEKARRRIFAEADAMSEWLGLDSAQRHPSAPWLGITLILAFGFFAGQFIAWRQLSVDGIYLSSNAHSNFFYILTGGHALHLFGGLLGLAWCAISTALGVRLPTRQVTLDATAWYWHAMGLLWLYVLGVMFYLR